jgi:hypothetical protein
MARKSTRFSRFLHHSRLRQTLFVEACFRLVAAKLLLRLLPFRYLTPLFTPPLGRMAPDGPERERLREDIRWAVNRATTFLPGKTVCFPRGIATQCMCRKRGINTILYYGAQVSPTIGLAAHVWVQDGAEGIIGHNIAGEYTVLTYFPC